MKAIQLSGKSVRAFQMFPQEGHAPEHQALLLKSAGSTPQSDQEKHVGVVTLGETVTGGW